MKNLKYTGLALLLALLVGGASFAVASAYSGNARVNIENWNGSMINPPDQSVVKEGNLGAHIDSPTNFTDLDVANDLSVQKGFTLTSTSTLNGLASVVVSGSFQTGTTTILSIPNPLVASGTVQFAFFNISSGATTTAFLDCTTSTSQFPTSYVSSTKGFFNDVTVAGTTTPYLVAGLTSGGGAAAGSDVDSNSQTSLFVAPTNRIICMVARLNDGTTNSTAGYTNSNSLFAGTFKLLFRR